MHTKYEADKMQAERGFCAEKKNVRSPMFLVHVIIRIQALSSSATADRQTDMFLVHVIIRIQALSL